MKYKKGLLPQENDFSYTIVSSIGRGGGWNLDNMISTRYHKPGIKEIEEYEIEMQQIRSYD